jgi:cyclase
LNIRVIPRLDIKGPNLVKGIHLEGLRVLGRPERFARYYSESGADELLYMDVVASLYGRNSLLDIVQRTSREIFIPLTVGGGLRSLDDIRSVLRAGADKVAINTAAIKDPEFIRQATRQFGSSTIVVSIAAVRRTDGSYEALTDTGREHSGLDAVEWALRAAELGAGELMVTSIDREGTAKGFDVDLTARIATKVSIPVIAAGGAGTPRHVAEVIQQGSADAVALASILHYRYARENPAAAEDSKGEGNRDFLASGHKFMDSAGATIAEIKRHLADLGVACRPADVVAYA